MSQRLSTKDTPAILVGHGLPEYTLITPDEIEAHLPTLLKEIRREFDDHEKSLQQKLSNNQDLKWEEVMIPLNHLSERLRWSWGTVCHLNGVCNSPELRKVHAKQQPEVVRLTNHIGQSKVLHLAITNIKESNYKSLDKAQKRILEAELLSMTNRGVGLDNSSKKSFNVDSERLAQLSTIFSNNVLDATNQWSLLLTKSSEIEGLPPRALKVLASAAKEAGDSFQEDGSDPTAEHGPWRLGLDMPRYIPFITYCTNRSLRELVYRAHVKRASHGDINNEPLIEEILVLRNKQAKRLGYSNWAELSLANKMANNVEEVETLLDELRVAAIPSAQNELKEMQDCASRHGAPEAFDLKPWDISYWAECLRKEHFELNQEKLRPWFPLDQVLDGLFLLCERLFNIAIEAADGKAPIWNDDVRFFKVKEINGSEIAAFYLDPFSRPSSKRGGAWMDECISRSKTTNGKTVLPVAYLICNQTPPTKDTPSLMSFEEVETLFHEFGHGLQHMLTNVDYPEAAGINNVEWDAVELPSQFMENWCLHRKTFMSIAKHWKTGEHLPEKEYEKLLQNRTFNSGFSTLRQIHFALTDIKLHSQWNEGLGITPNQLHRQIAETTTVIPPIVEDHFLCAFSHIFAGGYAAGYYSYKWAEVLSADAFAAFEEAGMDDISKLKTTGMLFRQTILSQGGSQSPSEIFEAFRGRPANTKALIRHSGFSSKSD